ncbi:BZ3500_MvSof-1268-A1-R1_Chr10-2g03034 [Microbotryum saponariae]|uniref:DNA 3'-5' helicase n=1 Tax=Microbotryum saponariae TaxID=289078 RepID=A0A2X0KZJ1_9BASI|nr:BZ3501_MvSof-1269-A2-R1_Chr10-2g02620 [Microbotryum saponariae]SDA01968.1 BZ3500_MvSof-1268-A1-R1_Chr10-2g03034 [Microbotryum saponariae]
MRSASKASLTASIGRVEPSSNPTPESPSIVRWNSRIPKEDRMDRDSLRIKVKLLLLEEFGDDFEPRPFQINAIAGLLELDRKRGCTNTFDAVFVAAPTGSGKSTLFEAMSLVFGKRAITIIISPLNALSEHQAAKLFMRGKMAVVVSKKTWLNTVYCTALLTSQSPEMHARNVRWSELIFTSSFRERIKLLVYDEAIKIAEDPTHFAPSMLKLFNNVSELVVKLCSLLRVRHPTKSTKF